MDSWKIFLLISQLIYLLSLPFVVFVKSFLKYFGIITCDKNYVCYTALTALKARDSCHWYLDSGCSRHMTGNKDLFKTLFEGKIGTVTFGDGSKSVIRGIGTVDIPGLPMFEDVWYVDGLKANLLSISQICDKGLNVLFTKYECEILDGGGDCMSVGVRTADNCYGITPSVNNKCFSAKIDQVDLWHQRLGHASHKQLEKISKCEAVIGLPRFEKIEKCICGPCQIGKQVKSKHPSVTSVQTSRPLELLHIDLMGPARVQSLGGKKYILVVVDDFTRYTWVVLLKDKAEAPEKMIHLCKKLQVEKDTVIARIRSDHGKEFENTKLATFCNEQGTHQEFSSPKTPQQNGIVERKNRVVQEMARVMLHNKNLPKSFWGEAVNTACHTLNRVYFRPDSKKTPYELWRGKKPVVKYFRIFGSDCYILRDRENLEKFDAKSDKGYFLGYSSTSRAYRVYNLRTKTVMESSNVVINDEVCSEALSESTALGQDKSLEVDDSLPAEYVGKHSEEELLLLNDTVSVPSSSEPSTPVRENQ